MRWNPMRELQTLLEMPAIAQLRLAFQKGLCDTPILWSYANVLD